ncbi:MAG: BadF/BadG/BcrA/BcrD ATPase family protein [Pyrinomonadaceae bacterium]
MKPRRVRGARHLLLGIDGGGTKTHAVITDSGLNILGEGIAGPSNPLRVGISNAATSVREAFDKACADAGVQRADVVAAEIGLAGVKREDIRLSLREALSSLGIGSLEIVTDATIALFGATGGKPGLVVIAGTGSICCGINAQRKRACAGGWGPLAGDEGGGAWIARRALQAVAHAADGRGPQTSLSKLARAYFNVKEVDDLSTALYAPQMTNERLAGFGKRVIEAAQSGDAVAHRIISEAGRELGLAAAAVIQKLRMTRDSFQVAYVGGVFKAGELVLGPLREEVLSVAPNAFLAPPQLAPAVAAAHMAREHLRDFAVAV